MRNAQEYLVWCVNVGFNETGLIRGARGRSALCALRWV
jgi:hypothetical protein